MPPPALNLVREAIELDNQQRSLPALVKYTEALTAVGGSLLDALKSIHADSDSVDSSSSPVAAAGKFLAVLNQCVERINQLFEACNDQSIKAKLAPTPLDSGNAKSSAELLIDDFEARASIADVYSTNMGAHASTYVSEDPVADAIGENRRLVALHVEKIKRGQMTPAAEATVNMALQRQMTENLELARQRKRELEAKKAKNRRDALDALEKNRETASLSVEEKQFIAETRTFEDDCADLRLFSLELNKTDKKHANSQEFRTVLEHYMDAILSIPDHPFCDRMRQTRHARLHHLKQLSPDARRQSSIRIMIEDDVRSLTQYFVHSLLIKTELKPKCSQVTELLNEAYVAALMPFLADFYRDLHAGEIKILKEKLRQEHDAQFLNSSAPAALIQDAADTVRSFSSALTPKAMLNILVSTCKAISCREAEPGMENNKLNTDDLLGTLAAVIIEAKQADIIVWAAIMEEFIASFGDGRSSVIGEEGFCLTSLHAAIQYVMSE